MPAEDRSAKAPYAFRAIEMKNVSELVSDYESKPVVIIAKLRRINGRVREDDNAIAWKWRRISIDVIDIVGNNEIDLPAGRLELTAELGKRALGIDSSTLPQRLQPARKVNVEVGRLYCEPVIVGRQLRAGIRERNRERAQEPADASHCCDVARLLK